MSVDKNAARKRRWQRENAEKHREACRRWRAANRERAKELTAAWAEAHPERRALHLRRFRQRHPKYTTQRRAAKRLRDAWRTWAAQCAASRRRLAVLGQ